MELFNSSLKYSVLSLLVVYQHLKMRHFDFRVIQQLFNLKKKIIIPSVYSWIRFAILASLHIYKNIEFLISIDYFNVLIFFPLDLLKWFTLSLGTFLLWFNKTLDLFGYPHTILFIKNLLIRTFFNNMSKFVTGFTF